MNGAKFKTLRQLMGLKLEWLAEHLKVQPRSIQRWENSNDEVPFFAVEALTQIHDIFVSEHRNLNARSQITGTFYRYLKYDAINGFNLPDSFYGAIMGLILNDRLVKGQEFRIEWFDPTTSATEPA